MPRSYRVPLAACLLALLFAPRAHADERAACVQAADEGQQQRDEGKYRAARESFSSCARDTCPKAVRNDCVVWLSELDASVPTVVLSAKRGTEDLVHVRVSIDGTVVADKLDGKPVTLDPGEHRFVFELEGTREERTVLVHAGQKNRQVPVVFADPSAERASVPPAPAPTPPSQGRKVPVASLVLAGVSAVGVGAFVGFGLGGKGQLDDMRRPLAEGGCAPTCGEGSVDDAKRKLLIADVSLGIGLAALAGSAIVYFASSPNKERARASTRLVPRVSGGVTRDGAQANVALTF